MGRDLVTVVQSSANDILNYRGLGKERMNARSVVKVEIYRTCQLI